MDEKKPVSDEMKATAAKKAAAAKQAAAAKKAGSDTREAPEKKEAPKKKAPKKETPKKETPDDEEAEAEDAEEAEEEIEGKSEKKQRLHKKLTDEERKQVKGLRIGAIVLWVLALACEVGAFFALHYELLNHTLRDACGNVLSTSYQWTDKEMILFIAALVLDAIFCIVAAQLWKKSNRISPCLASSKLVRTLWHQLGVIMVLVCFVPIGIFFLVKSKDMNKKMKTILIVILAALLASAGTASVDFQQPSSEEIEQMQQEAIADGTGEEVYWTQFGKSYHFDRDCSHIRNKTFAEDGGTLYEGDLQAAFDANRWDPCDECAGGAEAKLAEQSDTTFEELPTEAEDGAAE